MASPSLLLKLNLSLPPQQVLNYSGGGESLRTLSSTQAITRSYTVTTSKRFVSSRRLRHASKRHSDTLTYIDTGYAKKHKSGTSASHIYRSKASQLTVLKNCCLVRDTRTGYHFYISIHFLLHNELLQYSTLPGFSYMGFTGLTSLYTLQCSIFSYYQGYHQYPYRTRSKSDLTCF